MSEHHMEIIGPVPPGVGVTLDAGDDETTEAPFTVESQTDEIVEVDFFFGNDLASEHETPE